MSPLLNFTAVKDSDNGFDPLPDGRYKCILSNALPKATSQGDEMWVLTWTIIEGPQEGRKIFDNLVFSAAAMPRAKLILSRLGFDVTGTLDLKVQMLIGKQIIIDTQIDVYTDKNGKIRKKNIVPFNGYEAITKSLPSVENDDGIPF